MKYLRQLVKTEVVAIAALLSVAVVLAIFSLVQASIAANPILGIAGSAKVVFTYICLIGGIPVIAFGAPMYAALHYFGKASWLSTLVIGVAPGVIFLLVERDLGLWAMSCGAVIALATHTFCQPVSNYSSKPTADAAA